MKTSTNFFPRFGALGTSCALALTAVTLALVTAWAYAQHGSWPVTSEVAVLVVVGTIVGAAKRQVMRLRRSGRSAARVQVG